MLDGSISPKMVEERLRRFTVAMMNVGGGHFVVNVLSDGEKFLLDQQCPAAKNAKRQRWQKKTGARQEGQKVD
jgi:gamma-glutamyltranspeptidase